MAQGTKRDFLHKVPKSDTFRKSLLQKKRGCFRTPSQTKPKQRLVAHQSVEDVVHTGQVIVIEE